MQAEEKVFDLPFKPQPDPKMLRIADSGLQLPLGILWKPRDCCRLPQVLAPPPGLHGFHSLIIPGTVAQEPPLSLYDEHIKAHTPHTRIHSECIFPSGAGIQGLTLSASSRRMNPTALN